MLPLFHLTLLDCQAVDKALLGLSGVQRVVNRVRFAAAATVEKLVLVGRRTLWLCHVSSFVLVQIGVEEDRRRLKPMAPALELEQVCHVFVRTLNSDVGLR